MEAPSYPLRQKTSVAWSRMWPRRRSKRVTGACLMARRETSVCRRADRVVDKAGIVRTFVRIIENNALNHKRRFCLTANSRHQLLNLSFLLAAEWQERQTRRASVVAVEVHGILYAGYSEVADDALGGQFNAVLFFARERRVAVFECGVDFVARHGRGTREGQNGADRAESKRRFELVSGTDHDLEANFFLPRS